MVLLDRSDDVLDPRSQEARDPSLRNKNLDKFLLGRWLLYEFIIFNVFFILLGIIFWDLMLGLTGLICAAIGMSVDRFYYGLDDMYPQGFMYASLIGSIFVIIDFVQLTGNIFWSALYSLPLIAILNMIGLFTYRYINSKYRAKIKERYLF